MENLIITDNGIYLKDEDGSYVCVASRQTEREPETRLVFCHIEEKNDVVLGVS